MLTLGAPPPALVALTRLAWPLTVSALKMACSCTRKLNGDVVQVGSAAQQLEG